MLSRVINVFKFMVMVVCDYFWVDDVCMYVLDFIITFAHIFPRTK